VTPSSMTAVLDALRAFNTAGMTRGVLSRAFSDSDDEILNELTGLILVGLDDDSSPNERVAQARSLGDLNAPPALLAPLLAEAFDSPRLGFVWQPHMETSQDSYRSLTAYPGGTEVLAVRCGSGGVEQGVVFVSEVGNPVSESFAFPVCVNGSLQRSQGTPRRAYSILGGYAVGLQSACLKLSRSQLQARHQFGSPLGQFQAVSFPFARSYVNHRVCCILLEQVLDPAFGLSECAERLAFIARETLSQATQCVQTFGASGMRRDLDPAALFLRSSRLANFVAGATDSAK